jgi:CheY-like chemotaxis protein
VSDSPEGRSASPGAAYFRVLYIDDNRDVTDTAVDLLGLLGFEARGCYDGPSALELAPRFLPGVCMIDLNMPGMDGDEVAVRLRGLLAVVVLIAVTAMSDEKSGARIAAAGFDMHLVKPVDPRNLLTVTDSLLPLWERRLLLRESCESGIGWAGTMKPPEPS